MIDFAQFKPFNLPKFLPPSFDPRDLSGITKLYSELLARRVTSQTHLEQLLRDWNELTDAVEEHFTTSHILTTLKTNNRTYAQNYKYLIKKILPKVKIWDHQLEEKYQKITAKLKPPKRLALFSIKVAANIRVFNRKNIPLETREELLGQKYQQIVGALTARFEGKDQTLVQIGKVLEEPDRTRREAAWRTITATRLSIRESLDQIFANLIVLRNKKAKNAGFKNYLDFRFAQMHRFDYKPADCTEFQLVVKEIVVPLQSRIYARRRKLLKITSLRPWDLAVDAQSRAPLRPFTTTTSLLRGTRKILSELDDGFVTDFDLMKKLGLLDLANRKYKAPGAYQHFLPSARLPFIFHNITGTDNDVQTLLHELGHSFNSFATRSQWLGAYRHPPLEFAEVASMAMELLTLDKLGAFYSEADQKRSIEAQLEGIVDLLIWIATIDSFQAWIYTHPDHSPRQRSDAWVGIYQEFYPSVDWSALELPLQLLWHRQHHLFLHPLYYIEYGIAQLGALQLWANYQKNPSRALREYKKSLALGGSFPLPEIFAAAGIKFGFDKEVVSGCSSILRGQLDLY